MRDKKYYWLKLKENFFEEDTISWLEEQENGVYYVNFYMKLCLKSLNTKGILIRNVGEMLIPYDMKKLGEITHTKVDTVIVAMELFQKMGLVQILENGEIYITQLELMVGCESSKAALMRKKREQDKTLKISDGNDIAKEVEQEEQSESYDGNNVTDVLPNCYTEKEIDVDKDKDIEKELQEEKSYDVVCDNISVFKHFEKCGFIVSSKLMEFIGADIEVYSAEWLIDAANECVKKGKINNYGYLTGILQNWMVKGKSLKVTNESRPNWQTYTEMKSILDD